MHGCLALAADNSVFIFFWLFLSDGVIVMRRWLFNHLICSFGFTLRFSLAAVPLMVATISF